MKYGRRKPYTEIGIRRLLCSRCGNKNPTTQWQICADNNLYRPLCKDCDIALNLLVLIWMGDPEAQEKVDKYENNKIT